MRLGELEQLPSYIKKIGEDKRTRGNVVMAF
jgi:hypothetical protein